MKDFVEKNNMVTTITREYANGDVVTVTVSSASNKTEREMAIARARKVKSDFYRNHFSLAQSMVSIIDSYNEFKESDRY